TGMSPIAWPSAHWPPAFCWGRASTCARATALLRCLLEIGEKVGELGRLLHAAIDHLGVGHLGLGIARVLGERGFVPRDAGLLHGIGELIARRGASFAAEHAMKIGTGRAGPALLHGITSAAFLVVQPLAPACVAYFAET